MVASDQVEHERRRMSQVEGKKDQVELGMKLKKMKNKVEERRSTLKGRRMMMTARSIVSVQNASIVFVVAV